MAGSFKERRSGKDRRASRLTASKDAERRAADRRQFPLPEDPAALSATAQNLQAAVDAYKQDHGLARISAAELVKVLQQMGYRQA